MKLTAWRCGSYLVLLLALAGSRDRWTVGAVEPGVPVPANSDQPLPINLATALQLAQVRNLDIAIATQRIEAASAQLDRARVLWLPTIQWGVDYFRHDGQLQDVDGRVFSTSKSSMMAGAAPNMVFGVTEAIFQPLAARQVLRARQAGLEAAANDSMLAVAEAYFTIQQARGDLAGAVEAVRRGEEVFRHAEQLAPGLVPPAEAQRARAELSRRRQALHAARERWRLASADLARLLSLAPATLVEPVEPPALQVTLIPPERALDDLICQGLTHRPELAAQQALVQATLQRLREEKLRPLLPSVLLRGAGTNPAGTLAGGVFGGGLNGQVGDFAARNSFDVQFLWELQNLGFGNKARIKERRTEHDLSLLELFRTQDRIAAQVAQAHAQVESARERIGESEIGLQAALTAVAQNIEGMTQTKRPAGNIVLLVVRPQEAVAAVQALAQAYSDYHGAVADFNRSQFRLFWALGKPAGSLPDEVPVAAPLPAN